MAVRVTVYGTANMKQIDAARKDLDRLEKSAMANSTGFQASMMRLSNSASSAGQKMQDVGSSMTRNLTVPLAAVGYGLYKATQAAADDAQEQVVLANTLRNTTGATKGQIAQMESWISTQGKLLGVADDQLRPALATLATATGDLTKAQLLAGTAMDIAAAKGIPVETAAAALAKAYAGSTTALGKMLPGIDKAALKSKNFGDVQRAVAQIVGGQAAAAANTEAGARQKANVALQESIESLGTAFLPIMNDMTKILTKDVVPAITQVTSWFSSLDAGTRKNIVTAALLVAGLGPVVSVVGKVTSGLGSAANGMVWMAGKGKLAASGLSNLSQGLKGYAWNADKAATPMLKFGNAIRSGAIAGGQFVASLARQGAAMAVTAAKAVASGVVFVAQKAAMIATSVATGIATAAQWALNVALTANPIGIVVVAIGALIAGLALLFTKNDAVREGVTKAWEAIKNAASAVWNWLVGAFKKWGGLILAAIMGPFGLMVYGIIKNWDKIKSGAAAVWEAVVGFFKAAPQKIVNAFKAYVSFWTNIGRNIVEGIKNGISAAWGALTSWFKNKLSDMVGGVKSLLGISSPSKVFKGIGTNITEGMANGIKAGAANVANAASTMATDAVTRSYTAMAAAYSKNKNLFKVVDPFATDTVTPNLMNTGSQTSAADKAKEALRDLQSRTGSLMNSWAMGETVTADQISGQQLLAGIKSQAAGMQNFVANVSKLRKAGLAAGVVSALLAAGPAQAGSQAAALATLNKEEIKSFNAAQAQNWRMSRLAAQMEKDTKLAPNVSIAPGAVSVVIQGNADAAEVTNAVDLALQQLLKELRAK